MLILGMLVKIADDLVDLYDNSEKAIPFAGIYGFLTGVLIFSPFGEICVGALLAQLIQKKIDTRVHWTGLVIAVAILLVLAGWFKIPLHLDPVLAMFLCAGAIIDELTATEKHSMRLFLPLFALGALFFWHTYYPFVGVLAFDVGYAVGSRIARSYFA